MADSTELPDFAEYMKELQQHQFVVVKFGYSSCPPCNKLKPIFAEIKQQVADYIHFVEVDIINQEDIAAEELVTRVPLVRFYIDCITNPTWDVIGFNIEKLQTNFNLFLDQVYEIRKLQKIEGVEVNKTELNTA